MDPASLPDVYYFLFIGGAICISFNKISLLEQVQYTVFCGSQPHFYY